MTKATYTPVHAFFSNVIGGALIYQRAHARGIDPAELEVPGSDAALELYKELTEELGLSFEHASRSLLVSMTHHLCEDSVWAANQKHIARVLWDVLGDPTNNGTEPPDVYTKAAKVLYSWILLLISPTYLKS